MAEPYKYGFMPEPWINHPFLKVGPLLTSEEERLAYERAQQARHMNQPNAGGGLPSLMPADRSQALDEFLAPLPQAKPQQSAPASPKEGEEWLRENVVRPALEKRAPKSLPPPKKKGEMQGPPAPPPGLAGPQAETSVSIPDTGTPVQPVMSDRQQMLEELKMQRELIDQLYPQRNYETTPQQMEADKFAEREWERANALARLAFFSGITQGAGGSWEGVGRGFAAAGKVHAEGFERYQAALQNRAVRASELMDQRYQDDSTRSGAALELYKAKEVEKGRVRDKLSSELKDARKSELNYIDDYFKELLKTAKGDDLMPADPDRINQIMEDWRISRARLEVVDTSDVRDK